MPRIVRFLRRLLRASRDLHGFVAGTPAWCAETRRRIAAADEPARLLELWRNELGPYSLRAWWGHTAGSIRILRLTRLERALRKRVGEKETSLLLSALGAAGTLASLGPVTGIGQVARGEISRQDYLQRYGHRGPHEFELALADPAEDPRWLDQQIAQAGAGAAANTRLTHQQSAWAEARQRFVARWPNRRRWLDKRLAGAAEGARLREAARSEFTRVYRLIRAFAQRAGDITGAGDDVFFLYLDELLDLLKGDQQALAKVPDRRKQYAWYQSLPPLPSVIRGRFDPAAWLADPNRRSDFYDAANSIKPADSPILRGHPGASGSAEGRVRVLSHPDQADTLQEGEILVASTTNVGWTPLFPRAAALVTDIGAPLSHAAIVARELGIPAVVGCGRATALLRTGDRVRVDGSRGTVERMDQ